MTVGSQPMIQLGYRDELRAARYAALSDSETKR
ncbi:protein of unknown function [Paraburkholderia kururiensis]